MQSVYTPWFSSVETHFLNHNTYMYVIISQWKLPLKNFRIPKPYDFRIGIHEFNHEHILYIIYYIFIVLNIHKYQIDPLLTWFQTTPCAANPFLSYLRNVKHFYKIKNNVTYSRSTPWTTRTTFDQNSELTRIEPIPPFITTQLSRGINVCGILITCICNDDCLAIVFSIVLRQIIFLWRLQPTS